MTDADLFGDVLNDIASGPTVAAQGGVTAALMTRLHDKGMSLKDMGGPKIMARSKRTMQTYARELGLVFDDYVPRSLQPRRIAAKKRKLKADPLAYYREVAGQHVGIVLMRMGDFYEAFDGAAKTVATDLGIVLTEHKGVLMCGVPAHALDDNLMTLARKGRRVAVVEAR